MNDIQLLKEQLLKDIDKSGFSDKTIVFGSGPENAKIFMIGEAPGAEEEKTGRPFVGKAGKNLDEFMSIVGIKRDEIYISNVVKLRPVTMSKKTGKAVNRAPNTTEIDFFLPYLFREIDLIKPSLVVTLGNVPLKAVAQDKDIAIGDVHGQILSVNNKNVFPMYHPAAVIYNRALKETYYEDLDKIRFHI